MAQVLSPQMQPQQRQQMYSSSPLKRSGPSQTKLFLGSPRSYPSRNQRSSLQSRYEDDSEPASPSSTSSSSSSSSSGSEIDLTRPSSYSTTPVNTYLEHSSPSTFPTQERTSYFEEPTESTQARSPPSSPRNSNESESDSDSDSSSPASDATPTNTPDPAVLSTDDADVKLEPSRHVDYLSHEWKEEEIWSSWRHIVSKRWYYGERSRLENASWRTWAKQKHKLKTVTPDSLNWLKDCDVTWLYGPLQMPSKYSVSEPASEPPSNLSKSSSFVGQKKPILKKRSASEVMLQKSISASSLVKQAAAAVQAQQLSVGRMRTRPSISRAASDFVTSGIPSIPESRDTFGSLSSYTTSGLQTPEQSEKRHIRFDDNVEQCIALDTDGDEEEGNWSAIHDDDDSPDEGLTMKSSSRRRKPISRSNSRGSFSNGESKTIAKLPSTTLKDQTEETEPADTHPSHSLSGNNFWRPRLISPSPSQETLRPSHPSRNYLLGEEDEDADMSWQPSQSKSKVRHDSLARSKENGSQETVRPRSDDEATGSLRRTPSGMFMPVDEDEDGMLNSGILGKVVDTVNTAKDIAHVIWNVGWRK